jgi:hypothetical protein
MASSLQQYRQELENRNLPSDLIDRMVRSRQKSTRDVALQSGLGERIFDRILGGTSAAGYTIAGGLSDLAGGLGGFLGGPFTEDAATLKEFADEAYRRAKPLALEGYKQGSVTASKNAVPMIDLPFYSETEMLANLQDKINSPEYLGEFSGLDPRNYGIETKPPAPKLSEQEMANVFSEVEGKSDLYRQLAEIEARNKNKKVPDVDFIDPSLAEANKKQTRISQAKAKEEKALSAQEESFDQPEPTETAFLEAMKQFMADAGKEDVAVEGETKKQKLDRYKKEFEDVTGIDASGKVDKSRALMAFGLGLMQNRAGSGFNVGKILSSVGEAGEAAMPELNKAIDRADAAKLAAGKYALEQVRSDESAAAAFAKERRLADDAFNLKVMQLDYEAAKDKTKGKELKNVTAIQPVKDLDIHYGTQGGQTVLAKASGDASRLASTFNAYSKAQVMLNQMQSDLEEIAAADSPTLFKLQSRINNVLVGFGLKDAQVEFGDDKISLEDRVAKGRQTLINEFKRALLQESQVSDLDLKTLFKSLGEQNLLDNPNAAVGAISNMKGYFANKKATLSPIITQFRDEYYYKNDEEYTKVQEILDKALNKRFSVPKGVANEGRTLLDITQEGD